jgi:hypothetical protein
VDQKDYNPEQIPDIFGLRKQLSAANKQRHKFWTQLRAVRRQISRYMRAHEIPEKEFEHLIKELPKEQRDYLMNEWEAGNQIPIHELRGMAEICNVLWSTSQLKEELKRKRGQAGHFPDPFFHGPTCSNCQLPLTGRRRKFCSGVCEAQYRKRKYKKQKKEAAKKQETKAAFDEAGLKSIDGPNPQPGAGGRASDRTCQHYNQCLQVAIQRNWQDFHCERCNLKGIS